MTHRVSHGRGSGGGTQGLAAYAGTGRSEDRDFLLRHPLRGGLARRAAHSRSARGEVAKNAPQERFLHAPADDAPKTILGNGQIENRGRCNYTLRFLQNTAL